MSYVRQITGTNWPGEPGRPDTYSIGIPLVLDWSSIGLTQQRDKSSRKWQEIKLGRQRVLNRLLPCHRAPAAVSVGQCFRIQ